MAERLHQSGEMAARIRAFDWASTPLGPIEAWPENLQTAVDLMLASLQPVYIGWGEELISLYNDGYILIAGAKHPEVLGQPYRVMWAEIWDQIRPVIDDVMAGRSHYFVDIPLQLSGRPDRPTSWFTTSATPIRDRAGQAVGFYTVAIETTERVLAEASLKQNFEVLFNSIDEGLAIVEMIYGDDGDITDMVFREVNSAYERQVGIGDVIGRSLREMFPGVEDIWIDRYETVARTGESIRVEDYQRDIDRWFDVFYSRVDENGRFVAIVFKDITERKQRELALRESEERLRQFGEASSDVLWIRDAETLQWIYLTPAFETIYGLGRDTALRGDNMTGWLDMILPDDRPHAFAAIERVRASERVSFEYRIRRPNDGRVRWLRNTDFPMHDAAGRVRWLGGVGRDITEEKASARRQEVLVNELQHRARNLLGVVTAVAGKTLRQGSTVESFEKRLQALSRAQALLSQAGSDTVEVGALVRAELAAYAQDESGRVRVEGPEVRLTARQVQNFALALHELTTNAVKYGALKDGTARLAVTWEVLLGKRDRRRLALSWVESGVAVDPERPTRRGYGTELIQEALGYALGAEVGYELSADGVRCRVEMPINQPG